MKTKTILLGVLAALVSGSLFAQTALVVGTWPERV
jgi:hypothetical protein